MPTFTAVPSKNTMLVDIPQIVADKIFIKYTTDIKNRLKEFCLADKKVSLYEKAVADLKNLGLLSVSYQTLTNYKEAFSKELSIEWQRFFDYAEKHGVKTSKEIAVLFNLDIKRAGYWLARYRQHSKVPIIPPSRESVIELRRQGLSFYEIGVKLKSSETVVLTLYRSMPNWQDIEKEIFWQKNRCGFATPIL